MSALRSLPRVSLQALWPNYGPTRGLRPRLQCVAGGRSDGGARALLPCCGVGSPVLARRPAKPAVGGLWRRVSCCSVSARHGAVLAAGLSSLACDPWRRPGHVAPSCPVYHASLPALATTESPFPKAVQECAAYLRPSIQSSANIPGVPLWAGPRSYSRSYVAPGERVRVETEAAAPSCLWAHRSWWLQSPRPWYTGLPTPRRWSCKRSQDFWIVGAWCTGREFLMRVGVSEGARAGSPYPAMA